MGALSSRGQRSIEMYVNSVQVSDYYIALGWFIHLASYTPIGFFLWMISKPRALSSSLFL
jgi:hypothetical protein